MQLSPFDPTIMSKHITEKDTKLVPVHATLATVHKDVA